MLRSSGRLWRWLQSGLYSDQRRRRAGHLRRTARPAATVAAEIESLEARALLTFTYNGGALITNMEAQNVFLGSDWATNPALQNLAARLDAFTATAVAGTQLDGLTLAGYNVYRGTSTPGVVGNFTLDKSYPASGFGNGLFSFDPVTGTFSFGVGSNPVYQGGLADDPSMTGYPASIQGLLQTMVNSGQLQAPNSNTLYNVYVEPGVIVSQDPAIPGGTSSISNQPANSVIDFLGYHGSFNGTTAGGAAVDIKYAVMPFPGFPNGTFPGLLTYGGSTQNLAGAFNSLTTTASHEMSEAATDPDVALANATGNINLVGWYDLTNGGEVADLSAQFLTVAQGYQVQLVEDQNNLLINPNAISHTLGAPTNITYTSLTPTSGQLTWTGTPLAQGYKIYSVVGSTQTLIGSVGANVNTFLATGLPAGTNVSFQVQAFDGPTTATSSVVPGITTFAVASFNNASGKTVFLVQTGPHNVVFIDGAGHIALGTYINGNQAYTSDYGGMTATFNGTQVTWGDGSVWASAPNAVSKVTVTQFSNARGTPVYTIQNGTNNLAFVDGIGETAVGNYVNPTQALSSRYPGDLATIGGSTVFWQDGSTWALKGTVPQVPVPTPLPVKPNNGSQDTQPGPGSPLFVGDGSQQPTRPMPLKPKGSGPVFDSWYGLS